MCFIPLMHANGCPIGLFCMLSPIKRVPVRVHYGGYREDTAQTILQLQEHGHLLKPYVLHCRAHGLLIHEFNIRLGNVKRGPTDRVEIYHSKCKKLILEPRRRINRNQR